MPQWKLLWISSLSVILYQLALLNEIKHSAPTHTLDSRSWQDTRTPGRSILPNFFPCRPSVTCSDIKHFSAGILCFKKYVFSQKWNVNKLNSILVLKDSFPLKFMIWCIVWKELLSGPLFLISSVVFILLHLLFLRREVQVTLISWKPSHQPLASTNQLYFHEFSFS